MTTLDERFNVVLALEDMDEEKIKTLRRAKVIVVGLGGLGSWSAEFLLRSGIANLTIMDGDKVEMKNILRQNYSENDIGKMKAEVLKKKLQSLDKNAKITTLTEFLTEENVTTLKDYDLVIDGTDNMEARRLINEFCVKNNIPWIYGSAIGYEGYAKAIIPQKTACFECIFPKDKNPSIFCNTCLVGIMMYTNVNVATIQTKLAIDVLLRQFRTIEDVLLKTNLTNGTTEKIKTKIRKGCICNKQ